MPVMMTTPDEIRQWLDAPTVEALLLQRPAPGADAPPSSEYEVGGVQPACR
jgi:hypothetical protein